MKELPKFIAVIHVDNEVQALEQSNVAFNNGAGGVFLINHQISSKKLIGAYSLVRRARPEDWIGLNFLDLRCRKAIESVPLRLDGLWVDSLGDPMADSEHSKQKGAGKTWRMFASVAFKYQEKVSDPASAAKVAADLFDVIVTSGPATGQPPLVSKVKSMKGAMGSKPLALASGVTTANVADFMPHVDCFMVATGISKSFHELDPAKVRELADLL